MRADIVIVGAGFAGASTAYHLTRAGVRDVLILEREAVPGMHSSGRNAGLIRQLIEDPIWLDLALEGAARLREPPPELAGDGPILRTIGSLLVTGAEGRSLARAAARAGTVEVTAAEAVRLAPELEGGSFEIAYHTPTDAVADIHALLTGYLRAATRAGARLETGCEVLALETAGGAVTAVKTTLGRVETRAVVDAGGAWAGALSRAAGVEPPPFEPRRRHLFQSGPVKRDRVSPFVWDLAHGFYFRPEGPGLLLSACDEDVHPALEPVADPARALELAEKVRRYAPALGELTIARSWASLRTFAPDGRPVIGREPAIEGYHYVAGLGGHGVTTSFAVGARAARAILNPGEGAPELGRARFGAAPGANHTRGPDSSRRSR